MVVSGGSANAADGDVVEAHDGQVAPGSRPSRAARSTPSAMASVAAKTAVGHGRPPEQLTSAARRSRRQLGLPIRRGELDRLG